MMELGHRWPPLSCNPACFFSEATALIPASHNRKDEYLAIDGAYTHRRLGVMRGYRASLVGCAREPGYGGPDALVKQSVCARGDQSPVVDECGSRAPAYAPVDAARTAQREVRLQACAQPLCISRPLDVSLTSPT